MEPTSTDNHTHSQENKEPNTKIKETNTHINISSKEDKLQTQRRRIKTKLLHRTINAQRHRGQETAFRWDKNKVVQLTAKAKGEKIYDENQKSANLIKIAV